MLKRIVFAYIKAKILRSTFGKSMIKFYFVYIFRLTDDCGIRNDSGCCIYGCYHLVLLVYLLHVKAVDFKIEGNWCHSN